MRGPRMSRYALIRATGTIRYSLLPIRFFSISTRVPRLAAPERQRLLGEHRLGDDRPRGGGIDPVLREQIAAIGHDGVGVLHDLQTLEMVRVADAHAGADDLQHVHDPERPVALVRAQLAMIRVIDRDDGVDLR